MSVLAGDRPRRAVPLSGGHRNDNILLETGRGHRYVLRRYRHRTAAAVEAALAARLAGTVARPAGGASPVR